MVADSAEILPSRITFVLARRYRGRYKSGCVALSFKKENREEMLENDDCGCHILRFNRCISTSLLASTLSKSLDNSLSFPSFLRFFLLLHIV